MQFCCLQVAASFPDQELAVEILNLRETFYRDESLFEITAKQEMLLRRKNWEGREKVQTLNHCSKQNPVEIESILRS